MREEWRNLRDASVPATIVKRAWTRMCRVLRKVGDVKMVEVVES